MNDTSSEARITIVIPTVSRPKLVARAIESALAQTAQNIEIIVSDNGSKDETQNVLAGYRDPRLRKLRLENTIPASAHGNFIMKHVRSEFVLALSDDDYIEPSMVERVLDLFERRPDLSFVYAGCWMHYGTECFPSLAGPEVESGEEFLAGYFLERREVCWCACVTRVADIRAIGPLPEHLIFGDLYYWSKLVFKGSIGCIAEPLSHYTYMTDNLSTATPAFTWAREARMHVNEMIEEYDRSGKDRVTSRRLQRLRDRWVARYTANQFVWNKFRGIRTGPLLRAIPPCFGFFAKERSAWPRVMMALILPPPVVKWLILRAAFQRQLGAPAVRQGNGCTRDAADAGLETSTGHRVLTAIAWPFRLCTITRSCRGFSSST